MWEKIEILMGKRGISVYRLSKDTGIGQATISSWRTNRCKPKVDKLKILAEYFGVPLEELL
ncbi:helix-turn-helix domain-containing protein [Amedibacillus sp. YH-ame6]